MECPKCGFQGPDNAAECPRCGLIYAKFRTDQNRPLPKVEPDSRKEPETITAPVVEFESFLGRLLFHVNPKADSADFILRAGFFGVFFLWGMAFVFSSVNTEAFGSGFWHLVNLPFHEAGHIIFRPFGRLITSLGGTLGQLLMPLVCMGVFLVKTRDTFAASFGLWWLGQSFIDIAPYIDDARRLTMPLLGGNTGRTSPYGFHDWEYILTETGLLRFDHTFARLAHGLGAFLIVLALVWWGFLLYRYYSQLDASKA